MTARVALLGDLRLLPETQRELCDLLGEQLDFEASAMITSEQAASAARDAEIVLASPFIMLQTEFFQECTSIRYLGICGTSLARVDLAAIEDRQIILRNVSHYGDSATAEYVFMKLAMLARGVEKYQWKAYPTDLRGKTLGVIGFGGLGQAVAHLALAYGMRVQYTSIHQKVEWEDRGVYVVEKTELLRTSDVTLISVPTDTAVLAEHDFEMFKTNSVLIQISMGDVFNRSGFEGWIVQEGNFAIFDAGTKSQTINDYAKLPRVMYSQFAAGDTHDTIIRLGEGVVKHVSEYLGR